MGRVSANLTNHVPQPVNAIIPSSVNDSPRRITGILWDSSVAVLSIADKMNDYYRQLSIRKEDIHIKQKYEVVALSFRWISIVDMKCILY